MLNSDQALREIHQKRPASAQGTLVLFGELFSRGYANGLVEEATLNGYKVIKSTVGRRDPNSTLRSLQPSEFPIEYDHFLNVPLEAGFDMEPDDEGLSPVDRLKELGLKDWQNFRWPAGSLEQSRKRGRERFRQNVKSYVQQLEKVLPQKGAHVLFAHLMAGGVPRAKVLMPLMNRVFKGTGDRYMASEDFWKSPMGELCSLNFDEVTAHTLDLLIEETTALREKIESQGGKVSYVGYGYHGTEMWIETGLVWQSYSPYLQGWAKLKLEQTAEKWHKKGVHVCVYNCPEILTNSSSIFQGVEIPLYTLLRAFQKMYPDQPRTHRLTHETIDLLKQPQLLEKIYQMVDGFYRNPAVISTLHYKTWPSHSNKAQLETALQVSDDIVACHKDEKKLMVGLFSEVVFRSCGWGMFHDSVAPKVPVRWIGHDFVALAEIGRSS